MTDDVLARLPMSIPDWMHDADCTDHDIALWFSRNPIDTLKAKSICADCPVRTDCQQHALTHGERHGIWGGLTEQDRDEVFRRARSAAQAS